MSRLTDFLAENYGEIFRFANKPTGRLSQRQLTEPATNNANEKIIDFGTDYFKSSIPFLHGDSISFNRYNDYENMDQYPLINDALDVISFEATKHDENGQIVNVASYDIIDVEDHKGIRELEILERYKRHFLKGFCGGASLTTLFRNYIKMGDTIHVPVYSEDGKKIIKYVRVPVKYIKLVVDTETFEIIKYVVTPDEENGKSKGGVPLGAGRYLRSAEYKADEVYHLRFDPESSDSFPYGRSVLDPISSVFRKMRLLEEAILVYWISRAPERKIHYIDVGNMSGAKAERYLNDIKNKMIRKEFYDPNTGDISSEYNPMSMMEDYYVPRRPGGAETGIETLPGAQNLNQLDALNYFKDAIIEGLKVPSTYLRSNKEGAVFNDGRVGLAYIQEIRFAAYIESLQKSFIEQIEVYFRQYLEKKGVEIETAFYLEMTPPSSYKDYQENELSMSNISNYTQLQGMTDVDGNPVFSEEFLQEKYLRMTSDEISKNKELVEEYLEKKEEEEPEEPVPSGEGEEPTGEEGGEEAQTPPEVPPTELP